MYAHCTYNQIYASRDPSKVFVSHLEEKDLAPSTIRHAYLLVGGLFSSALESDLIVRSPCRGIKLPNNSYTEMRFLTAEEVTDLAEVLDGRHRALVLTAAYAGCRFGELAGLKTHRFVSHSSASVGTLAQGRRSNAERKRSA